MTYVDKTGDLWLTKEDFLANDVILGVTRGKMKDRMKGMKKENRDYFNRKRR